MIKNGINQKIVYNFDKISRYYLLTDIDAQ